MMGEKTTEIAGLELNFSKQVEKKPAFQQHAGNIVEAVIRRKGHNISKLAKDLKVSRCTLYNWFDQSDLPFDVLVRIGTYIHHDFARDFPDIFDFQKNRFLTLGGVENDGDGAVHTDYWMKKYINLLERYNQCLIDIKDKS